MTISTKTFQNLQPGVSAADDLRVRTPINQALQWLGEGLANELNAEFASISASLSNINSALAQISQSVSVQIAAAIATHQASAYHDAKPTFMAHKNGVAQVSISGTATPLTFGTESWDTGDYFASNGWTPPAGKHRLSAAVRFDMTNAVDGETLTLELQRDGSAIARTSVARAGTTAPVTVPLAINVNANGSNVYTLAATKSGAGVGTIEGSFALTWFTGEQI
jgi:hypothetical protein